MSLDSSPIDDEYAHIMVLSTARSHGLGPQRLPDRFDRGRRVAALQVEHDGQAREIFRSLDRADRWFYVDAERKQDLHLIELSRETLVSGHVVPIKPNDVTVDAFQAVVSHRLGTDLTNRRIGIFGSGNLAFKFALRMTELGAKVSLQARNPEKVELLVEAINRVLPKYTPNPASSALPGAGVEVLASVVTAEHNIGEEWLSCLAPEALCIDVGIDNLAPRFIAEAHLAGHTCMRLDIRSAGDPLPLMPNPFFDDVLGRSEIAGVSVVGGGQIGHRGEVVVDSVKSPSRALGLANGTGGLIPPGEWSREAARHVQAVREQIESRALAQRSV